MSEAASDIVQIVQRLRRMGVDGRIPADTRPAMTSVSSISENGASAVSLSSLPYNCPRDLLEFWSQISWARLFEDERYGQWGLLIASPEDAWALTRRSRVDNRALNDTDFIIGEFLGDSDLLMVRCDESDDDFGCIIVVSPIDPRNDWALAAKSFGNFLKQFLESEGEKYWDAVS